MKKVCKSFLLFLAMFFSISTFIIANSTDTAKAEELPAFTYEYDEVNQTVQSMAAYFSQMTDVELDYFIENYVGMNKAAFQSIKAVKEKGIGDFISADDCKIKEYKDYIIANSILHFKDEDVKFKVKFQYISQTVTPVSIEFSAMSDEKKQSMGEKMATAGMNTVMGMGTVFVVLVFLSLVISLFALVPVIQGKFFDRKKNKNINMSATTPAHEDLAEEENLTDDLELIAVITAAIAASENGPASGFIVRSIKRSPQNKWKNA